MFSTPKPPQGPKFEHYSPSRYFTKNIGCLFSLVVERCTCNAKVASSILARGSTFSFLKIFSFSTSLFLPLPLSGADRDTVFPGCVRCVASGLFYYWGDLRRTDHQSRSSTASTPWEEQSLGEGEGTGSWA